METFADRTAPNGTAKASAEHIAFSLIQAIRQQRLAPGTRLGEEDLAAVFHVSRTTVRQALTQLASQGLVGVKPRKGWFVVEPTDKEVKDIFSTRRLVEGALIQEFARTADRAQIKTLREHLNCQHTAIADEDVALRTHLLADFHVRIAEMLGNEQLTRIVRDLTMRSNLISMLYQSRQEASESAAEHELILKAIEARNVSEAMRLMTEHINSVEEGLQGRKNRDPVRMLQETLSLGITPAAPAVPVEERQPRVRTKRSTARMK